MDSEGGGSSPGASGVLRVASPGQNSHRRYPACKQTSEKRGWLCCDRGSLADSGTELHGRAWDSGKATPLCGPLSSRVLAQECHLHACRASSLTGRAHSSTPTALGPVLVLSQTDSYAPGLSRVSPRIEMSLCRVVQDL